MPSWLGLRNSLTWMKAYANEDRCIFYIYYHCNVLIAFCYVIEFEVFVSWRSHNRNVTLKKGEDKMVQSLNDVSLMFYDVKQI